MTNIQQEIDDIYLREMDDSQPEEMTMEMQFTGTDLSELQDRSLRSQGPSQYPSTKTAPTKPHPYPHRSDAFMSSSDAQATCYSGHDAVQVDEFTASQCHQYFNNAGNNDGLDQNYDGQNQQVNKSSTQDLRGDPVGISHIYNNKYGCEDNEFDNIEKQQLEEQMISFFADNEESRIEIDEFLTHLKDDHQLDCDLPSIHDSTFIQNNMACDNTQQSSNSGNNNLFKDMPIEQSPHYISFDIHKEKIGVINKIGINEFVSRNGGNDLQNMDLKQTQQVYERILNFYSKFGSINTENKVIGKKRAKGMTFNQLRQIKSSQQMGYLSDRRNVPLRSSSPIKSYINYAKNAKKSVVFSPGTVSPTRAYQRAYEQLGNAEQQPQKHYLNSEFMKKLKLNRRSIMGVE